MYTKPENSKKEKDSGRANRYSQKGYYGVDSPKVDANSLQLREAARLRAMSNGLPNRLKAGIENLSGYAMDDVKVHRNSNKPAQYKAHAYTQGSNIYLASGQEKKLPHEAWHVVQQKQGRVKATERLKNKMGLSHDLTLEREADAMGTKANRLVSKYPTKKLVSKKANSNLIQCYLDDEQRENIHGLFSGAYGTATFKRMSFSKEDRQLAWMGQAHAEMDLSGAAVDPEIIEATITEMGLTAQGINLRHVIPYSDIAGVLRVATSDSTISVAGPDYARSIRHQVTKLTELIGSEESKRLWAEGVDSVGLLKSKSGRDVIRGIYRDLAHSQANLFQGSGSPNKAIGNRPDVSVYATGILGRGHVEKLLEWWYETMEILELNPIFSQERVYNISSGTAIPVDLHSHALSRPLGPIYGYSDELEMIPRN